MLYVPADKERMLQKALALEPDSFIFDLEDAVAAEEKPGARVRLADFFKENESSPVIGRWVRINNPDDLPDVDDIKAVVHSSLTGVVVPMVGAQAAVARSGLVAAGPGARGRGAGRLAAAQEFARRERVCGFSP